MQHDLIEEQKEDDLNEERQFYEKVQQWTLEVESALTTPCTVHVYSLVCYQPSSLDSDQAVPPLGGEGEASRRSICQTHIQLQDPASQ